MKTSLKSIKTFLEPKKLAIAGVSRNEKKFGYAVYKELREKGFKLYPVNPNAESLGNEPCFRSVSALPVDVKHLLILTKKDQTLGVLKEAIAKGMDNIWIQQMSETPEVLEYLKDKQVNVVAKQCILMFAEPAKSFHRFHRGIKSLFGLLPR
jgi:uncharacterized protein